MYDYQSQTSLPPIRTRQQRQSGVQVQQLYESSPVLAALTHHQSSNHYQSQKGTQGDAATVLHTNGIQTNNGTTNAHGQHQYSNSQAPSQPVNSQQSLRKSPSADSVLSMRSSSQQRRSTNVLDPDSAMKVYMSKLTAFERHEIFSYPEIYFVGQNARKRPGVGGGPNNGMSYSV